MKRQNKVNGSTCLSLMDTFMEISDSTSTFTEDDIVKEICTFMLAVRIIINARTYLYTIKNNEGFCRGRTL